jgi:propionyl-CoA carboxylase alpha chain
MTFQRDLMAAVACAMHRTLTVRAAPELMRTDWIVIENDERRAVQVANGGNGCTVTFTDDDRVLRLEEIDWRPGLRQFSGVLDGRPFTAEVAPAPEGFVIRHRAAVAKVLVLTPRSAALHEKLPPKKVADTSKKILSPMPGLVVSIEVVIGQQVRTGEVVGVVEAMKMQNIIRAERDGTVRAVGAKAGDSVAADDVLVEFA